MRHILIAVALAASWAAGDAVAGNHTGCPPGLAKKSPACIPPGQAKKRYDNPRYDARDHRYRRGEVIRGDYVLIEDPWRHGLDRGKNYVRLGNYVYRIDRQTREVLDLIGAVSAILN